jgi:hypothetical protein
VTELPQHVRWLFQDWHFAPFYIRLRREGNEGYRFIPMIQKLAGGAPFVGLLFAPSPRRVPHSCVLCKGGRQACGRRIGESIGSEPCL